MTARCSLSARRAEWVCRDRVAFDVAGWEPVSRVLDVLDSVRAGWAVDRVRLADVEAENARLRAQLADALSAPPALFVFESGVTDARVVAGAVSAPS